MGLNNAPGIRMARLSDAEAVGREAAHGVACQLAAKPDSSLVFPTGKTPLPMYGHLRGMHGVDWSQSRLFQLDEYLAPAGWPGEPLYQTFAAFLDHELWAHVDGNTYYMRDYTGRLDAYEAQVMADDGPDLVILGIGGNGHIAFNEPGSDPDSGIRVVDLARETLVSNFGPNAGAPGYPTQAITLGLRNILAARHVMLLATGVSKQAVVRHAFNPATPPDAGCPASWLKTHPHVTVFTDFDV